ncbi:MAG: hypothetical protein ACOCQ1_03215 [Halanaerobiaceae bacterium]
MFKENNMLISFIILLFVVIFCFPARARLIPVNEIDEIESELYGEVEEDQEIRERLLSLEKLIYGQKQDGTIINRVERISEFVLGPETGQSLRLMVNTMEWSFLDDIGEGPLVERINNLSKEVAIEVEDVGIARLFEMLAEDLYSESDLQVGEIKVPASREVKGRLEEGFSSEENKVGDKISFRVEEDVIVDDYLVIPAGTRSELEVLRMEESGFLGRDSEVKFAVDSIQAMDGTSLNLTLPDNTVGESYSRGLAAGASLLGIVVFDNPLGLLAGVLVKGQDVTLPENSRLTFEITEDVIINSIKVK